MAIEKSADKVHVEGTQFYKRSAFRDVLRIVIITIVTFVAIVVLATWAIIDAGARQAFKEARDIRRALRIVGTEYYGSMSSIYDQHSANGMTEGAAQKIADISTRDGDVILYAWDDVNNAPLQFEYRTGLYRVIYTDKSTQDGLSVGVEGDFHVYYSFEILRFDAQ
ncbi:MAG: hypothetical protein K6A37_02745 [Saccharofermentans sp.]|nr:hypothetical protein [Saccharofermentans sp.]